jgi:hypothetical protein
LTHLTITQLVGLKTIHLFSEQTAEHLDRKSESASENGSVPIHPATPGVGETAGDTAGTTPNENADLPTVASEDVGNPGSGGGGGGGGGNDPDSDPTNPAPGNSDAPEIGHGTNVRLLISGHEVGVGGFLEMKTYLKFFPVPNPKQYKAMTHDTIDSHAYVEMRTSQGVMMDYSLSSLSCVALMGAKEQLYLRHEK